MKSIFIVTNGEYMQTAWFNKKSAIQQSIKTNKEERQAAKEAGEEFDGYTVVEMAIQDSVSTNLEFDDDWWLNYGGDAVTEVQKATQIIANKANVDILTALDYIRGVIEDRIS